MNEEMRKELEYEEQFYGMSSKFFVDSFKNFMKKELNLKINLLVNNFKNKILGQAKNVEQFECGIEEMRDNLVKEYSKSLDKVFKENELEIFKIFSIPPNVLLKEDQILSSGIDDNIDKVRSEVKDLKLTYQSLLYVKQCLMEELVEVNLATMLMENFISENKVKLNVLPADSMCELSEQNREIFKTVNSS